MRRSRERRGLRTQAQRIRRALYGLVSLTLFIAFYLMYRIDTATDTDSPKPKRWVVHNKSKFISTLAAQNHCQTWFNWYQAFLTFPRSPTASANLCQIYQNHLCHTARVRLLDILHCHPDHFRTPQKSMSPPEFFPASREIIWYACFSFLLSISPIGNLR